MAITLTTFIPGTKAKAEEVNANFSTLADAVNAKASISGDDTQTFAVAEATDNEHAINKSQLDDLSDDLTEKINRTGMKFCVRSGYTTSGEGDLFSYSALQITPKIGTGFANLIIADYKGIPTTISSASTFSMSGKPDGDYNIFIKTDGTLYTLKNTIYVQKARPTMIDGDIWLNTSVEPFNCIKYDGTNDVEFLDVPLGKVTISSSTITSLKTFAYNQNGYNINTSTIGALKKCWVSDKQTLSIGTRLSVTHNLNFSDLTKVKGEVLAVCKTADLGYSVGDIAEVGSTGSVSGYYYPVNYCSPTIRANTISYLIPSELSLGINSFTTGRIAPATLANWDIIFRIWY